MIPTDKKGTDHTCHSLWSSASSLIYSFCLLPLSALHLYPSCFCSWNSHFLLMNSGPCQQPVEGEKILKKAADRTLNFSYLPFLRSSSSPILLSLCGQMCWNLQSGTPSKLLCIQLRRQMLTASCTARLDRVGPNGEARCCSTAQEPWCSPVLLASTLQSFRGRKKQAYHTQSRQIRHQDRCSNIQGS